MKKLVLLFLVFGYLLSSQLPILAVDNSKDIKSLTQQIEQLEQQIRQKRQQRVTLQAQLHYIDSQIRLTQLKVKRTQAEMFLLQGQIKELSGKIGRLDTTLNKITAIFLTRVASDYKLQRINPLDLFFTKLSFGHFYTLQKYYQVLQDNDRRLMFGLEETRMNYDLQKKEKKKKQVELARLEKQLASQQKLLAERKASKERLLEVTRNDEKRYQQLLAAAVKQLNALRSFAEHRGGGLLPPQPSPVGWYYNQRDERWGRQFIGASDMRIWEVGCLVTSVAMLFTKNGVRRTPADIASNVAYFFSDTAYMLWPWPNPPGYHLVSRGADFKFIDQELAAGRPVIAHLNIGTADGHFVVLKQKVGNDYIMNDPWYGPNLKLSSHYSRYQITSASSYRPN